MLSPMLPLALEISPYEFACDGEMFGIPHFWNVASNGAFLLLGLYGLWRVRVLRRSGRTVSFNWTGIWASTAAIGLGSMAYHSWLNEAGLALDRFAICGLMAFIMALAAEVALGIGPSRRVSLGLFVLSQATVVIWLLGGTEWPYAVLQALAGVGVVAVVVRADMRARRGIGPLAVSPVPIYLFSGCYALAKVAEALDVPVCELTGFIGGHPFKHLLAALGLLLLGRMMGVGTHPAVKTA